MSKTKEDRLNETCYHYTFELIELNKKALGLGDDCVGVPKVIHDLCMICYKEGYNKAKRERKK